MLAFFLMGLGLIYNPGETQAEPFVYVGHINAHQVSVIDVATDTVIATIDGVFRPHGLAITPDGTRAYVTNYGYNRTVTVIDTATNTIVDTVSGVGYDPGGIAITPDGTKAYVANRVSNNVSVIDITTNTVMATIATARYPVSVAITPDSQYAYVANQTGLRVTIINTSTNRVAGIIDDRKRHVGIAIRPDGSQAYVVNDLESSFSVIDMATNSVISTVPTGGIHPYWVAISPDGTRAYIANVSSDNVAVIETETNSVIALVPVERAPYKVAVTPDNSKAYVGNVGAASVSVLDTETNTVIETIAVAATPLAMAITPVREANIEVDPLQYDFGHVQVGSPSTMYLSLSNNGGAELIIEDIYLDSLISGDPFTFYCPFLLPLTLVSGSSLDIEVMYNPTLIFAQQANSLVIESSDQDEGVIEVPFQGWGVLAEEPSQAMTGLKDFLDQAIASGMITGQGSGKSADKRLHALRNMIDSAGDLIANGAMPEACAQLGSIYKKLDGQPKPPDFASGVAVPGIAAAILELKDNLDCPVL